MPKLLKIPAAAAELSTSRSSIYRLIAAGQLRRTKVGKSAFISSAELERFVAAVTEGEADNA